MISFSSFSKRRGTTLAGIFSLALGSLVLLCGAGSAIQNLLPQGAMQGDLNAGGYSVTNAATLSATNVVVSGSLTAPSSFTLPYSQVTGTPTLGPLSSVSPSGTASSTTFLKYDGTTFSYATPPGNATSGSSILYGNGSGGFSNATVGTGLTFSSGALSVTASTYDAYGAASGLLSSNNTWSGSNNFTGTFEVGGAPLGSAAFTASSAYDASGAAAAAQSNAEAYASNGTNITSGTIAYSKLFGTPSSLPPNGSAGGDLGGSYPNPSAYNASHLTNFPGYSTMGLGSAAAQSTNAFVNTSTLGTNVATALTGNLDSIGNLASQPAYVADEYGAVADGQQNNTISITTSSATITAGSSIFASTDVGKAILVYQGVVKDKSCTISSSSTTVTMSSTTGIYAGEYVAGSTGSLPLGVTVSSVTDSTHVVLSADPNLSGTYTLDFKPTCISTTISSYTSATQVTLATTMAQTTSNVRIVWGTDNTTAVQNAVNALNAAGGGTLLFNKVGIYCFAGALQDTSIRNSVILLPNSQSKEYIAIRGQGPCNLGDNGLLPAQNIPITGTALFCFTPGSGTNPSVFGGNYLASAGSISGLDLYVSDIGFVMPMEATTGAINMLNGGGMILDRVSACADFPNYSGQFPATATTAFIFANSNNDAIQQARTAEVDGFGTGILGYQHLTLFNTQVAACNIGVTCNSSAAVYSSHFVANVVDINFGSTTTFFGYGIRFEDGIAVGSNVATQYTITPGSTGSNGYLSYGMITGSFSTNAPANTVLALFTPNLQTAVPTTGFLSISGSTDSANRAVEITAPNVNGAVVLSLITPYAVTYRKGFGVSSPYGAAGQFCVGLLSDTGAALSSPYNNSLTFYPQGGSSTALACIDSPVPLCGNGSAPTYTAGAGAGSSPTISISGTNLVGEITITTGSSPSASATVVTITPANGGESSNHLMPFLQPANANAGALSGSASLYSSSGQSATSWTISVGSTALTASTTYVFRYYLSGI